MPGARVLNGTSARSAPAEEARRSPAAVHEPAGDPEQDYFAEGMVEEIAGAVARQIPVRDRRRLERGAQAMATTPQEAARTLGVRYVLEGSVRKAAEGCG